MAIGHNVAMCGRYEPNATPQRLRNHLGDLIADDDWRSFTPRNSYNLAPSQNCLVIRYSSACPGYQSAVKCFRLRWIVTARTAVCGPIGRDEQQ